MASKKLSEHRMFEAKQSLVNEQIKAGLKEPLARGGAMLGSESK